MAKYHLILILLFVASCLMGQNPVASNLTDQFDASGGVKLGPDGFLYVANFGAELDNADGTQVWRVNRVTGDREVFATGLAGASGNAFDSQGNLFQSNIAGNWIAKIDPAGNVTTFTVLGVSSPVGIAIDDQDNVYVANCGDNTIQKFTPAGGSSQLAGGSMFSCPNGITLDHENNVYVTNFNGNNNLIKITPDGTASVLASIDGNNNGHLTFYAPDTMLYVNSHGSSSIYRVSLDGNVTKIAGTGSRGNANGPALTQATFSRPNGIAISPDGDTLWINSSIPTQDNPGTNFWPLNPSVMRMVTGLKAQMSEIDETQPVWSSLRISPNPATDVVHLELELKAADDVVIELLDNIGNTVLWEPLGHFPKGVFRANLSLNRLASGVYYVVIGGRDFSLTRKIVVN